MIKIISFTFLLVFLNTIFCKDPFAQDYTQKNVPSSAKEEIVLGHVKTNARMATPCGKGRRNVKAELQAIEGDLKKLSPSSQSI